MKNYLRIGVAIVALSASSLSAHPVTAPAQAFHAGPVTTQDLTLDAGTPIALIVDEDVSSTSHRQGDTFRLKVASDIRIGDTVVIPRGTPAVGEITWRTGKGAFGKSGKIEFSLRYIDLNGQHIPVSGDFRQEGEGNTVATGVGVIAVGVFAGFITGKRARLPMGRELTGKIALPVQFTASGQLSPSYNSRAMMAAAEAETPHGKCRASARALPQKQQARALKKCSGQRLS